MGSSSKEPDLSFVFQKENPGRQAVRVDQTREKQTLMRMSDDEAWTRSKGGDGAWRGL